jgi:hypothetical protein
VVVVCLHRYHLVDAQTLTPASRLRVFTCGLLSTYFFYLFSLTTPLPFGLYDKYQRSPIEKALGLVHIRRDG